MAEDKAADEIAAAARPRSTAKIRSTKSPLAARCPSICRASASCIRRRRPARAAAASLRKLGEDITETLERVPAQWKVIQHVREKFSLPHLRGHHAAAGAVASDRARPRRTAAPGPRPVRQVPARICR